MNNVLFNASITVPSDSDDESIKNLLLEGFSQFDFIYSYLVKNKSNYYEVNYMISQTDRYNTINIIDAIYDIFKSIKAKGNLEIVCYKQPPIDLMVEIYEPLVKKLAAKQARCWKQLEYEDLCQMCYYVIVKLYNDGYYIHKSLVEKSFVHEVLMSVAKDRDKPVVLSLQHPVENDKDSHKGLTISDCIVDESYELDKEASEHREFIKMTFDEVKDILVELLGPRRFDAFYRDYANSHTTGSSRLTMYRVKTYLASLGITMEDFIKKYYG